MLKNSPNLLYFMQGAREQETIKLDSLFGHFYTDSKIHSQKTTLWGTIKPIQPLPRQNLNELLPI